MNNYPKRLIEVDLPIREISAHARREKDMRRGHVPLLYIWPATRPTSACRAILCATLWPDPADENCPKAFRTATSTVLSSFADHVRSNRNLAELCKDHWQRWNRTNTTSLAPTNQANWADMRYALLDFIADFANPDAAQNDVFLRTARLLTLSAHVALFDRSWNFQYTSSQGPLENNTLINALEDSLRNKQKPLILDPFSGGGAIPLESLRIGTDTYSSDLNPLAILYNKLLLEYAPKYGEQLINELTAWNKWAGEKANEELKDLYPIDGEGNIAIAYLWARTIICEGPGCGAEIPLLRNLLLARKTEMPTAIRLLVDKKTKHINFDIVRKVKGKWISNSNPQENIGDLQFSGTTKHGSVSCPVCGYTTPVERVREQLCQRRGGTSDSRLYCVVTVKQNEQGRIYRLPTSEDLDAISKATKRLKSQEVKNNSNLSLVPNEPLPPQGTLGFRVQLYGMQNWGDLFTPRQALAISTYSRLAREYSDLIGQKDKSFVEAVLTVLTLVINRLADLNASLCVWQLNTPNTAHVFGRWALPMVMDFGEINPLAAAGGSPDSIIRRMSAGLRDIAVLKLSTGVVEQASATNHPLPDDSVDAFVTDPPYYDAVPYADLSDFFYVWAKRTLYNHNISFQNELTPKQDECIVDTVKGKDRAYFEQAMTLAMTEGRRLLKANGVGVVIFAHKTTSGWEAFLQSMIDGGWRITASWPIDTEMGSRLRAKGSAALASSIHLVCRPREAEDGTLLEAVGDWRDVLNELPERIHSWLPRLAQEGVVGADAIFACLGPALEIFSRYSRVEKASGEQVTLKEYLEVVWSAVAREVLSVIFEGADATGFEEDARLTAMWLWTISTKGQREGDKGIEEGEGDKEETASAPSSETGYVLEFDAARKIAQGLGAHLERLDSLVEIKGDKVRLRSVSERARALFGKQKDEILGKRKKKDTGQMSLFNILDEVEAQETDWTDRYTQPAGKTSLDQLHQAMLLFATGRGESLKRFLTVDGVGKDQRFWRLAQTLSALYPSGSDEKRWVDGVLGRKKGLGF